MGQYFSVMIDVLKSIAALLTATVEKYDFLKERILNIEKKVSINPLDNYATEEEVMKKFKVNRITLYRLRKSNQLKATKTSLGIVYLVKDLDAYLMTGYSSTEKPDDENIRWEPKKKK